MGDGRTRLGDVLHTDFDKADLVVVREICDGVAPPPIDGITGEPSYPLGMDVELHLMTARKDGLDHPLQQVKAEDASTQRLDEKTRL